jgi:predicted AlkP superfamily phosphohydrolase/phosphomutase
MIRGDCVTLEQKVIVIGIDGGCFDILRPLAELGVMPHLRRILDEGVTSDLTSTMPPITAAAWTSFATGVNPGKHGLVDFVHFPSGGYDVAVASARDVRARNIWDMASEQGRTVGIIGVPMTYPAQIVNGFLISGFMAPPGSKNCAYPPGLLEELEAAVGRFVTNAGEGIAPRDIRSFAKRLLRDVEARVNAAVYLLGKRTPDLFVFVFQCLDGIQHRFHRILEVSNPHHDPRESDRYRDDLLSVYHAVDKGIGRLRAAAGDEAVVFLMSDHGFGALYGFVHLNNWLRERGYLVLRRDLLTSMRYALFRAGFTPETAHELSQLLGLDLRYKVNRGQSFKTLRRIFLSFDSVDWSRTRAYALGHVGQVFINLRGRQPQGRVAPGSEYEALRDELSAELLALQHPTTGEYLISRVYHREELYSGSQVENLPDLLLEPRDFHYVAFGESEFASNRVVGPSFGHSGHHRMNGVFAATGPGVRAGAHLVGARILDIAPTVLYTLGCAIPETLDGQLLKDVFPPGRMKAHAPRYVSPQCVGQNGSLDGYSDDEEAIVRQRLRNLGYIA